MKNFKTAEVEPNPHPNKATNQELLMMPAESFFIELLHLPAEIETKNLSKYIAISLEGITPFPIEQVYWGFLADDINNRALVYAIYTENIRPQVLEEFERFSYVFPSFLGGMRSEKIEEPLIRFFVYNYTLSALYWEPEISIPVQVESITMVPSSEEGMLSHEEILKYKEKLIRVLIKGNFVVEEGYWLLEKDEVKVSDAGEVLFHADYIGDEGEKIETDYVQHSPQNPFLWNADIRKSDFIRGKKRAYKLGQFFLKGIFAALIGFGVLLLGEGIRYGLTGYEKGLTQKITSRKDAVARIEAQERLAEKIEQVNEKRLSPFEMISIVNQIRPKLLYFTSVRIGVNSDLLIEGASSSVDVVNQYSTELNNLKSITSVDISNIVSRRGSINFTMSIQFSDKNDLEVEAII